MSAPLATDSGRPLRDWSFGLMWVLASAAGIGLGIGATYGLVFLVKALVPGVNEDTLGGGLIYILLASLLSFFQWLVLRGRIPRSARWFAATIAGLIIGFVFIPPVLRVIPALQGRDAQPLLALLVMIIIGGILGLAQWLILRRHIRISGLWVVANVLGWATASLFIGRSIDKAADMIALAVIPAVWTGLALVLLWDRPEKEAPTLT